MAAIMTPAGPSRTPIGGAPEAQRVVSLGLIFVDWITKRTIFRSLGQEWPGSSPVEDTQVSKAGKRSREKFDTAELFTEEDFDSEDFVVQMDDKSHHHKAGAPRTGWRRLEQLREEQQLREQLSDLADWDDVADF
jgi:protein-tyrosine-phosphatase